MSNNCFGKGPSGVLGNSIDICIKKEDKSAEIRADVVVDEFDSKRIWGQVLNCHCEPVANSLVKLVRVVCDKGRYFYEGVAHTITNCEGFYQFDVCNDKDDSYKIIVSKAIKGIETVINTGGGNCHPCSMPNHKHNVCSPYNPIVKPYIPIICEDRKNHCESHHHHGCHEQHHHHGCHGHHKHDHHKHEHHKHDHHNNHHDNDHDGCKCSEEGINSVDRQYKIYKKNYATYTK